MMNYLSKGRTCLALAIALLSTSPFAKALDFNTADGSWFTPGNWTPPGPPTIAQNAAIGTVLQPTAIARINTGGTATANNVSLGRNANTDGTLRINSGSTLNTTNDFLVGDVATGTFIALDSTTTNVGGNMTIGNHAGSTGTARVEDDAQVNITGNLRVGDAGDGTLRVLTTLSNPVVQANNITVGNQVGSTGLIELDVPTNQMVISAAMLVSNNDIVIGALGDGTMRITNGAFSVAMGDAIIAGGAGMYRESHCPRFRFVCLRMGHGWKSGCWSPGRCHLGYSRWRINWEWPAA